jgi:hypothetical protein
MWEGTAMDAAMAGGRQDVPAEHRVSGRFQSSNEVVCFLYTTPEGPGLPVEIIDLSAGGAALGTVNPFERNRIVILEFHERHGGIDCLVSGRIVYCVHRETDERYVTGCAFLRQLSREEFAALTAGRLRHHQGSSP